MKFNIKKSSQISMEYMIITGIAFTIIFVLIGYFVTDSQGTISTLDQKHIKKTFSELTSEISKIYFLGEGNRETFKTIFPSSIANLTIHHIENRTVNGTITSFDYFAVKYVNEEDEDYFFTSENYVRFDCFGNCTTDIISSGTETQSVTYWNDPTVFSQGDKKIIIESRGDVVSVDFGR
jgi:hypothetical protein